MKQGWCSHRDVHNQLCCNFLLKSSIHFTMCDSNRCKINFTKKIPLSASTTTAISIRECKIGCARVCWNIFLSFVLVEELFTGSCFSCVKKHPCFVSYDNLVCKGVLYSLNSSMDDVCCACYGKYERIICSHSNLAHTRRARKRLKKPHLCCYTAQWW